MILRIALTIALAVLLILALSCRYFAQQAIRTPIIVGDGSIHIHSTLPADFTDAGGHWDKSKKNEWKRKDKGKDGTYGLVFLVKNADTANPTHLKQIADLTSCTNGDKCKVEMEFLDTSSLGHFATITVEDENGSKGMVVSSPNIGFDKFTLKDPVHLEYTAPAELSRVVVYNKQGQISSLDKSQIDTLCETPHAKCGVSIDFVTP